MKRILILFVCVLWGQSLRAQIDPTPTPPYVDAADLRKVMQKKNSSTEEESVTPQKGKLMKLVLRMR